MRIFSAILFILSQISSSLALTQEAEDLVTHHYVDSIAVNLDPNHVTERDFQNKNECEAAINRARATRIIVARGVGVTTIGALVSGSLVAGTKKLVQVKLKEANDTLALRRIQRARVYGELRQGQNGKSSQEATAVKTEINDVKREKASLEQKIKDAQSERVDAAESTPSLRYTNGSGRAQALNVQYIDGRQLVAPASLAETELRNLPGFKGLSSDQISSFVKNAKPLNYGENNLANTGQVYRVTMKDGSVRLATNEQIGKWNAGESKYLANEAKWTADIARKDARLAQLDDALALTPRAMRHHIEAVTSSDFQEADELVQGAKPAVQLWENRAAVVARYTGKAAIGIGVTAAAAVGAYAAYQGITKIHFTNSFLDDDNIMNFNVSAAALCTEAFEGDKASNPVYQKIVIVTGAIRYIEKNPNFISDAAEGKPEEPTQVAKIQEGRDH